MFSLLFFEESHRVVDLLAPLALLVQEDGELAVLGVEGTKLVRVELEESWSNVFHIKFQNFDQPHIVDRQVSGTQSCRLVFVDCYDNNLMGVKNILFIS